MANNRTPRDAKQAVVHCAEQGMPNLCGAVRRGVSIQHFQVTVAGGAVAYTLIFEDEGGANMHDALYTVQITNHTTQGTGICALADRAATQLIVTSVAAADVLDVLVVGQLDGQLA